MKKIFCAIFAALMMTAALSGCGETAEKTVSTGKELVTDVVSGAGEIVSGMGSDVSSAVSGARDNLDQMQSNAMVSDNDGFIANDETDPMDITENPVEESTASPETEN